MDTAQARLMDGAFKSIVKSNDRYILRNFESGFLLCLHRTQGGLIVTGKHGCERNITI